MYKVTVLTPEKPIAVAERSKARVCGRSPVGTAGSNPTSVMDVCLLRLWVLSVRGLWDEPITRPEKFYRLWYVSVCDLETSRMSPRWAVGLEKEGKKKITTTELRRVATYLGLK
jgi:hypothetical protein